MIIHDADHAPRPPPHATLKDCATESLGGRSAQKAQARELNIDIATTLRVFWNVIVCDRSLISFSSVLICAGGVCYASYWCRLLISVAPYPSIQQTQVFFLGRGIKRLG